MELRTEMNPGIYLNDRKCMNADDIFTKMYKEILLADSEQHIADLEYPFKARNMRILTVEDLYRSNEQRKKVRFACIKLLHSFS